MRQQLPRTEQRHIGTTDITGCPPGAAHAGISRGALEGLIGARM